MAFMQWTQNLSVGVKEIDEQHKKLIEIVNKAHEIDLNEDKEKGNEIFKELIEYVRVHFSTEEKYFEQCNYPGAEEHIAEHALLTEKVLKFKDEYDKGECDCEKFLNILKEWLENHLVKIDQLYVDNFKACGLK